MATLCGATKPCAWYLQQSSTVVPGLAPRNRYHPAAQSDGLPKNKPLPERASCSRVADSCDLAHPRLLISPLLNAKTDHQRGYVRRPLIDSRLLECYSVFG